MPELNTENVPEEKSTPQKGMRLSSVITFIFLSTAAIVIAYICGVMAGRSGYVPEVKNEMPRTNATKEPLPTKNATQAILLPQDLDYARVLRNEKARERVKNSPTVEQESSQEETIKEDKDAAKTEVSLKLLDEKVADNPQEIMLDYVFQLGAFKDEDTVDALRQKLEGRGLRTRMQKDGKLYLVFVLLRGLPERAAEVTAIAKELRLGEPIVRSKKAVPPQE